MRGRSGAREAGAHLSQALEEGAGAATRWSFFGEVGGMWPIGVTERKSLARALSLPTKKLPQLSLSRASRIKKQLEKQRRQKGRWKGRLCMRLCDIVCGATHNTGYCRGREFEPV